jgi:hypothetical protein
MDIFDMKPNRNPYRISKPRNGIIWKGKFFLATEKGYYSNPMLRFRSVLTEEYLWLNSELAIPLTKIKNTEIYNKGKAIKIIYLNILSSNYEIIYLCMLDVFGFYHRKKVQEFIDKLLSARKSGKSVFDYKELGCESCGCKEANMLNIGVFMCAGIYPLLGMYSWAPMRRYLCKKHALQKCLLFNLIISFCGYLGLPGMFIAPYMAWKNISEVNNVFPQTKTVIVLALLLSILLPLAIIFYVLIRSDILKSF